VSGPACRDVAERLGLPQRMRQAAPAEVRASAAVLLETERVLASVTEALIGACYLNAGYERTAEAVVEAFTPEIEEALENPVDFKSALQELLARRGAEVSYEVTGEEGPPHERTYAVTALVDGRELGSGRGRSKKQAEQEAARAAVERLAEE
ncbi:MAG TPA: putative dsRNA-binding protein, partial [Solirubrobacteraceae bacterium]|nr:putative dsRNA-binding protein [Solirubrobacteraceae bacterium]